MLRTSTPALNAPAKSRTLPFAAPIIKARVSPSNSLERRKVRAGARVTLGADGEVLYSSGSLTRGDKKSGETRAFAQAESGNHSVTEVDTKQSGVMTAKPDLISADVKASGSDSSFEEAASSVANGFSSAPGSVVKRNESYRIAAHPSVTSDSSPNSTFGSVGKPAQNPFRIEAVKATNIKPMPLFKGIEHLFGVY
jgi:hypothetical protein